MDWDRLGWIKMKCSGLGWNWIVWNRLGWIKMKSSGLGWNWRDRNRLGWIKIKCSGLEWNQMEYDGMNCLHSDLKVVSSHSKNR